MIPAHESLVRTSSTSSHFFSKTIRGTRWNASLPDSVAALPHWLPSFVFLIVLCGCAVGPNYKRPALETPGNFRGAPVLASTNSFADLPWWEVFKDDTLQALIRTAFTNNYDLRIAIARVEQSRAILEQNRALLLPQLDYQ